MTNVVLSSFIYTYKIESNMKGGLKVKAVNELSSLRVRSNIRAGRTVCYNYDEQTGIWYPSDPNVYPPPPAPVPPPPPGMGPWLSCQACTGTKIAEGHLKNAKCEVCTL